MSAFTFITAAIVASVGLIYTAVTIDIQRWHLVAMACLSSFCGIAACLYGAACSFWSEVAQELERENEALRLKKGDYSE